MKFHLFITGCQYNYYDVSKITRLLQKMGYLYTEDEYRADLIVVLACSVRQKPMDRIYGKIKLWKQSEKHPKIIVVGCVLPRDRKNLEKKNVNVVSVDEFKDVIPNLFRNHDEILNQVQDDNDVVTVKQNNYDFTPSEAKPDTAYIPIMQGCNNYCTYCAVPYTRGRERSRTPENIIKEIKTELKNGKKHIVLLGQNVNSYRLTNNEFNESTNITNKSCHSESATKRDEESKFKNCFTELLKQIDKIDGDFDFNFMSSNPRNFSGELIKTLPKLKKWERTLHLPLQSGNDEILKKMNRKYTVKEYISIISNLKFKIKNLIISTDIIVGFPGETKKQFEDTVKLCKKIGFRQAFVNQYSPRVGTVAAKMKDTVSKIEKKRRWTVLNDLINR